MLPRPRTLPAGFSSPACRLIAPKPPSGVLWLHTTASASSLARMARTSLTRLTGRDIGHRFGRGISVRSRGSTDRNSHGEGRACPWLAGHGYVAAHHAREFAGYREAEASSTETLRSRDIRPSPQGWLHSILLCPPWNPNERGSRKLLEAAPKRRTTPRRIDGSAIARGNFGCRRCVRRPDPCFSTSSRTPPRAASLLDGGV